MPLYDVRPKIITSLSDRGLATGYPEGFKVITKGVGFGIESTVIGGEWYSEGSSDSIADRPSAALFGKGTWQSGSVRYTSDSNNWTEPSTESDNVAGISISAWGDSLTLGSGSLNLGYPALLGKLTGYNVFNGGVGGETSTQIKTRMLAASAYILNLPTIIWAGRNNYTSPTTVKNDIAAMVSALTNPNYIILGVTNDSTQVSGSAGWTTITTLNNDLALLYGSRFIDIRAYLVAQFDPGTPQDVIDNGNDILPSTLRGDTIHLNQAGYTHVANRINQSVGLLFPDTNNNYLTVDTFKFLNKNITNKGIWQNGAVALAADPVLPNLYVGFNAGRVTTGINNTFVGWSAGALNTTGLKNTFVGWNTGARNTTGNSCTFVGNQAGGVNTTGIDNTFVGHNAGVSNTTANSNTFVGFASGSNNTGNNNTFVGHSAGANNTSAIANTFMGLNAGTANTTGASNTFLGYSTSSSNTTGGNNTSVGYLAGRYQADGATGLTTAASSTYIGSNARGFNNSDANTTVIGANAIGRGANTVTIGASTVTSTALQGFICETSKEVVATAALTAATITKGNTYLTGTAGASMAITLPAAEATVDGQKVMIMSVNERVATTWISTGATGGFIGAPATMLALTPYVLQYDHASLAWYLSR